MWFLIPCNYINLSCGLFEGSSPFFFNLSFDSFVLVLGGDMGMKY
jgi:hypothetical protein